MNKCFLPMAAAVLLLAACSEKPSYEIAGTVTNADLNGKYVYLTEYGVPDAQPFDSALVTNGTFAFSGTQDESRLVIIGFADDVVPRPQGAATPFKTTFTLEDGKIAIALDTVPVVTGTPANDAVKALHDQVSALFESLGNLTDEIRSEDKAVAEAARKKYEAVSEQVTQLTYEYILNHIGDKMAARYLYDNRYQLSEEQQNTILAKADSTFKAQPNIDKLMAHLEVLKKVAVGKQFTDFEMADAKGEMHKLSDFVGKGKVVLIDFWASWCPPCRAEMPDLVALYKANKAKGFEIVGISLDSNADAWAKGVKDLGITWTQLSDLKGWQNAGAALYGVNSIPHTVLVDKEGVIVAKNLHGEALAEQIEALLK